MYKNLQGKYGKDLVFEFPIDDTSLVLVGYPTLRAFIVSKESRIGVEVIPNIDLNVAENV